jgi:hypothetical protein
MRAAFGPNTYEMYQVPPIFANTSLISPGVIRIPLTAPTEFIVEDPIIVIYGPLNTAIYARDSTDFTIQSITLFSSWYMGLVTTRVRRLNVNDYHVKPREGF